MSTIYLVVYGNRDEESWHVAGAFSKEEFAIAYISKIFVDDYSNYSIEPVTVDAALDVVKDLPVINHFFYSFTGVKRYKGDVGVLEFRGKELKRAEPVTHTDATRYRFSEHLTVQIFVPLAESFESAQQTAIEEYEKALATDRARSEAEAAEFELRRQRHKQLFSDDNDRIDT